MSEKMFDIIGMGAALLDILAQVPEETLAAHKIPKGNMALVESTQLQELCAHFPKAKRASGGATANTLVAASAQGATAGFIGAVGADEQGWHYVKDLGQVAWLGTRVADIPTGGCLSLITPDGQRSMTTALGASAHLNPSHVPDLNAKILLLEGYLWDSPAATEAALNAAAKVKASGGLVALNLSDALCVERHLTAFQNFTPLDILLGNEDEAKTFYQSDSWDEVCDKVAASGFTYAALTRGEKGAVLFEKSKSWQVAAQPIKKLVDSTGAGDAFAGGFLAAISAGETAVAAGAKGAACAAQVIQQLGARA